MLEKLQQANPDLEILSVIAPEFSSYGTIHPTVELPEMRRFLYGVEQTEFEH